MLQTVFDRSGGFARVRHVVAAFYDRALDSPLLRHRFERIDMRRLVEHQTKFIASLMEGPAAYDDGMLRRAHAPLGITQLEFAAMLRLLRDVLEDQAFDRDDIDRVTHALESRADLIVAPTA